MIRFLNIRFPAAMILLVAVDLAAIYGSLTLGLTWSYAPDFFLQNLWFDSFVVEKLLFVSITLLCLFTLGAYYPPFLMNMKMGLLAITLSHVLAMALLTLLFYLLPDLRIWISALVPAMALSLISVLFTHFMFDRLIGTRLFQRRILVLGDGNTAESVREAISRSPYAVCAASFPLPAITSGKECSQQATTIDLFGLATEVGAQEIVVALDDRRGRLPLRELLECRARGMQVTDFSTFVEQQEGYVEIDGLHPSWMIFSDGFTGGKMVQKNLKRLSDIVLSLILLALTAPIIVIAGIAIAIGSSGPVLYRQARVGANDRVFSLWKLRSMKSNAEADGVARWSAGRDDRVTQVGRILRRFRIDELPQLFNVLRGHMSFIGPRPERPEFVTQLARELPYYRLRHILKPGITGWAQIHYPYGSSVEDAREKLKFDLYYVKNYSLVLDFIVLVQTLRVIIWPERGTKAARRSEVAIARSPRARGMLDGMPKALHNPPSRSSIPQFGPSRTPPV